MKQSQYGSGVGKTWSNRNNKKGQTNKPQNQHQSDKKENVNRDTHINNGVHLVHGKCMSLCNKGCVFNNSHTTGFYDTWAVCV